eukprot:12866794-Alexandrium_andersonii.AAC.1
MHSQSLSNCLLKPAWVVARKDMALTRLAFGIGVGGWAFAASAPLAGETATVPRASSSPAAAPTDAGVVG